MAERPRKDKLPTRPSSPADYNSESQDKSVDYYLEIQASAALEKYKGSGKGLEVFLSSSDFDRLNVLKEIFGLGFELNNAICAADYFLTNEAIQAPPLHHLLDMPSDKRLKLKPNKGSMIAILRHGKEDSATFLLKLGIDLLYRRLGRRD